MLGDFQYKNILKKTLKQKTWEDGKIKSEKHKQVKDIVS